MKEIFDISLLSHFKSGVIDIPAPPLIASPADSWHSPPPSLLCVSSPHTVLLPGVHRGHPETVAEGKGIAKRKIKKLPLLLGSSALFKLKICLKIDHSVMQTIINYM